jgi:hypothetical protein
MDEANTSIPNEMPAVEASATIADAPGDTPDEIPPEATTDAPREVKARVPREMARYPLAFDVNGNPLKLPPEAVAWRVRRGGGRRGRPRHVYDTDTGRQLEIPLAASVETLIECSCPADRYLLYPIDALGNIIPGIVAVTEVPETEETAEEVAPGTETANSSAMLMLNKEQHATIREMAQAMCRAIDSTSSGYHRIRPAEAAPVILQPPPAAPAPTDEKPKASGLFTDEQIAFALGKVAELAMPFLMKIMSAAAAPTSPGAT